MRVAFLDRDGTINRDYEDSVWAEISEPEVLPFAMEGLKALNENGYAIIILTNQYIIGDGVISLEQYKAFTGRLFGILQAQGISVLDVFYCPHSASEGCSCMKPNVGLFEQAMAKYPNIDVEQSFFCGDSESDRVLAERVGLRFYGVGFGENSVTDLLDLSKRVCVEKRNGE